MEDDQNGRRPKWKTTKMEDEQNGRRPKWKTTKTEDDQITTIFVLSIFGRCDLNFGCFLPNLLNDFILPNKLVIFIKKNRCDISPLCGIFTAYP